MSKIDEQGRLQLSAEEYGYKPGDTVLYAKIGEKKYEIVHQNVVDSYEGELILNAKSIISDKSRIIVPKQIRSMYTQLAELTVDPKTNRIYLYFIRYSE